MQTNCVHWQQCTECFRAHLVISIIQLCVSQSGEPHFILACEWWSLSSLPISYQVQSPLFGALHTFSRSYVVTVPACLKCVGGIRFRKSIYVQRTLELRRLNIKYSDFLLFSNEHVSSRISKCSHSILQSFPTFLESSLWITHYLGWVMVGTQHQK